MKIKPQIKPRGWQKEAFKAWKDYSYKGIFEVATGGGKTVFSLICISHLFEKSLIDSVVIIVPTITLRDQWESVILETFHDITSEDINLKKDHYKTFNIFVNLTAQKISFNNVARTAFIADECHRFGTPANLQTLDKAYFAKIGLTATLERKYDEGIESVLLPTLGEIIYRYNLKKALNDGVVTPYELFNIKTELTASEQEDYKRLTKRIILAHNNDDSEKLKRLLIVRRRLVNESYLRAYVASDLIFKHLKRKKIIFSESIDQAEEIRRLVKERGLDTAVYHSKLSKTQRINNLRLFISGYYHTLIGCKSLDEGFDVPDITLGIICSQSSSSRQRIQRIGRTIRVSDNKQISSIYTLYSVEQEKEELMKEETLYNNLPVTWMEVKVG